MAIAFTMPLDCRVNRFSVSIAQSSTGALKSMIRTGSRHAAKLAAKGEEAAVNRIVSFAET